VEHLPLDKLQPEAALDLLTSLVGVQRIQQESDIAEQLIRKLRKAILRRSSKVLAKDKRLNEED
jgi:hypothetical protein